MNISLLGPEKIKRANPHRSKPITSHDSDSECSQAVATCSHKTKLVQKEKEKTCTSKRGEKKGWTGPCGAADVTKCQKGNQGAASVRIWVRSA